MPRAADSQAVLAVVTRMNGAPQQAPPGVRVGHQGTEPYPETRLPFLFVGGSCETGSRWGEPAPVGYVPPGTGLKTAHAPQGDSRERQADAERDEGHRLPQEN